MHLGIIPIIAVIMITVIIISASSSTIFDKTYPMLGMGNANGVLNQDIFDDSKSCNKDMTVDYDALTSVLTVKLPIGSNESNETLLCYDGNPPPCKTVNPTCETIGVNLQSLGYNTEIQQTTTLTMEFSMIAVTTA